MTRFILGIVVVAMITGSAAAAVAQGTSQALINATPSGPNTQSASQPSTRTQSGSTAGTVSPDTAYSHGNANVGNSSESNGILGSHGNSSGATTQTGNTANR